MDIDITEFFRNADPFDYSASRAERGQNARAETWNNAKQAAKESPLLKTPNEIEALRDYVKDFGAWSDEEIAAWDNDECNALFIQLVSGDIREADLDTDSPDWAEYERGASEGRYGGNIFPSGDQIFYSLAR